MAKGIGIFTKERFQNRLVITAQTYSALPHEPYRELVKHAPGVWSSIDVVAEINFDCVLNRTAPDIVLDLVNRLR